MSEINETYILDLLTGYQDNKRRIALLTYELENLQPISEEEMLEAMTYARAAGGLGRNPGAVSDKTAKIAAEYRDRAAQANAQLQEELTRRLLQLMLEVNRLESYVRLLPREQSKVLTRYYFEGYCWEEVCQETGHTPRTVRKLKSAAISTLAEMYRFAEGSSRP